MEQITELYNAIRLNHRLKTVLSRFSKIEDESKNVYSPGVTLKIVCVMQLLEEAHLSLSEWIAKHPHYDFSKDLQSRQAREIARRLKASGVKCVIRPSELLEAAK